MEKDCKSNEIMLLQSKTNVSGGRPDGNRRLAGLFLVVFGDRFFTLFFQLYPTYFSNGNMKMSKFQNPVLRVLLELVFRDLESGNIRRGPFPNHYNSCPASNVIPHSQNLGFRNVF